MPGRVIRAARRLQLRPIDLLLVGALLIIAYLVWSLLFPTTPFSYINAPFLVNTPVVHQGQALEIVVGRCNQTSDTLIYAISRAFQNVDTGEETYIETLGASAPPGCATSVSRAHTVPGDLRPGRYRLVFIASVQTPRGIETAGAVSEPFVVVAGSG